MDVETGGACITDTTSTFTGRKTVVACVCAGTEGSGTCLAVGGVDEPGGINGSVVGCPQVRVSK